MRTDKNMLIAGYIFVCLFLFIMMYIGSYNLLPLTIVENQTVDHKMNNAFNSHYFEVKYDRHVIKYNKKLLMTIFTTFSESTKKMSIFANTMKIWALLKPFVQPVLYCYNSSCLEKWSRQASTNGWHIYRAPVSNEDRIPLLKYMYLHAIKNYNSSFYGYCNGDILFDESFLKNFRDLEIYARAKEKILVIGQRSNYHTNKEKNISTLLEVSELYTKAKLFTPWAIDYFMYTKNCIDWEKIPNFVVGKERHLLNHFIPNVYEVFTDHICFCVIRLFIY